MTTLQITERIWLRYASPKSCFAGLQIRSERYTPYTPIQNTLKGDLKYEKHR